MVDRDRQKHGYKYWWGGGILCTVHRVLLSTDTGREGSVEQRREEDTEGGFTCSLPRRRFSELK